MYWVNTMVRKLSCIEPTPKVRALFSSIFYIDNYYCCACSKTSISINKYRQKPERLRMILGSSNIYNYSHSAKLQLGLDEWLQVFTSMVSLSDC